MHRIVNHGSPWRLTRSEIRVSLHVLGVQPRPGDVDVVASISPTTAGVAAYVWDHILGEPSEPAERGLQSHLDAHIDEIRRIAAERLDGEADS